MMRTPRLTELAQRALAQQLRLGDCAIDATLGNGHDCLLLAQCVGATGQVLGCDIQAAALHATRERLGALQQRVQLYHCGHEQLAARLPSALKGQIRALVFNLGYLPGADHHCITHGATTLAALDSLTPWLATDGVISIMAYPGHAGGEQELQMLLDWLAQQHTWRWQQHSSQGLQRRGPEWLWLSRADHQ